MKIPDDLSITLLSKKIASYKSAKNLGVTMDCNLTYDEHKTQLGHIYNSIEGHVLENSLLG